MKRRANIKIYGEVQGIGYRSLIARKAKGLNLRGFIRNEIDDTVLIVVEGDEEAILKLIEECRKVNPLANIREVKVEWQEYRGEFKDFEIEYREYELPRE